MDTQAGALLPLELEMEKYATLAKEICYYLGLH
jgi:hypothetical protein